MKRLCIGLSIIFGASGVWADWTSTGEMSLGTAYADFQNIRKNGNQVKVWTLFNYRVPQETQGSTPHISRKVQKIYDCSEERSKATTLQLYDEPMGGGHLVFSSEAPQEWRPIPPDSMEWKMLKIVCK